MKLLDRMNVSIKISALLIITAGITIIVITTITYVFINNSIQDRITDTSNNNSLIVTKILNDMQAKAAQIAVLIASNDKVRSAYLIDNDSLGLVQLKRDFLPVIDILKETADSKKIEIHFHKPPAKSFLRVWTDKRGDDLSKFRATILKVYETKKVVQGIELGVGGFAIRGIAPIIVDGKYLGSCEMIYNPEDVLKFIATDTNNTGAVFLVDQIKAEKLFEKSLIDKNCDFNSNGYFISKATSSWFDSKKNLDVQFFKNLNPSNVSILTENGLSLTTIPINDFSGDLAGYFTFYQKIGDDLNKLYSQITWLFIVFCATLTVLNISMLFVFRKIIIKPIKTATEVAKKVASGDFKSLKELI